MDNSNNPNSPNPPTPSFASPPPPPDFNTPQAFTPTSSVLPASTWPSIPTQSEPTSVNPVPTLPGSDPTSPLAGSTDPAAPAPVVSDMTNTPWTPPVPVPAPTQPADNALDTTWNPTPIQSEPTPPVSPSPEPASMPSPLPQPSPIPETFTPTQNSDPVAPNPIPGDLPATPITSPLDNPWGSPVTPPDPNPPLQSPSSPPTWMPESPATPQVQPVGNDTPLTDQTVSTQPAAPTETPSVPTDLSHLIGNNPQEENGQNPSSAETLVVPTQNLSSVPDVPTLSTQNHKSIPKWLIGVGVGLLIIVTGASAYFILGIGQPSKNTTSLPAETTKPTVQAPPVSTPIPQPAAPAATGSANFGQLQGGGTPQATSAADLIKQRQQQAR